MSTKINPTFEELGGVLANRLKQRCSALATAALDRCWISYWYAADPGGRKLLPREDSTLLDLSSMRILVLQSNSAIAVSYLRTHWQEVAEVWQSLTGTPAYIALFSGNPGESSKRVQLVLFETIFCSRVEVEL